MKYKKISALFVAGALLLNLPLAALSADNSKEETVYVILEGDGSPKSLYVVNSYETLTGSLVDYGDYESVRNLTTTHALTLENGQITSPASGENFYYEGKLSQKELPWSLALSYTLDGTTISPKDLAGKSGKIKISLNITQNSKGTAAFYEGFVLQISTTLDTKKCRNIIAKGATLANVGEHKNISFTGLPNQGGNFEITADVTNFEMDALMISAVPFSMTVPISGVDNVAESFTPLSKGISDLNNGAQKLKDGAKGYGEGLSAISNQSDPLVDGSAEIAKAIAQIAGLLDSMGPAAPEQLKIAMSQLNGQYTAFHQGLMGYAGGVKTVAEGFTALHTGVNELSKGTAALHNETKDLGQVVQDKIDETLSSFQGKPYAPISFVSEKNTHVSAVQFVMKTDPISLPPKENVSFEEPVKVSFWGKLLALFH